MRSHGKSSSGSWWKTYVSDTRNYDVVWDIRDQDPRLKIINGAVYADDLERANWRKQVVFSRNRAQEAIRKASFDFDYSRTTPRDRLSTRAEAPGGPVSQVHSWPGDWVNGG
eukprot:CAMPEP_0113709806 /NCGR_PEP_ID=MMETSP0038_2-20120614/29788_1 /TAXON_ID=2898 /ORGANISM="Cryptomonas paramecium" /LENGTH=111 /DNA_ID=CAMNT_0000635757 /DNA_START=46 /DNA_END=377 /DNA_ORIENTATION=- /assembly_acc=CAM_ASM_000170